jgi:hypothetical protein
MQDRPYRLATAMNAMGYTQDPTLSYDPAVRAPNLNLTFVNDPDTGPRVRVVVSAPPGRALTGRVRLQGSEAISLDPSEFDVRVGADAPVVRSVALAAAGAKRLEGLVRATLDAGPTVLTGQVPIRVAGGFIRNGVVIQAEAFTAQTGGEVRVRDDKANVMAEAISHWDDEGHTLTWEAEAPQGRPCRLVLRYCAPHRVTRTLRVDGADVGTVVLPATGGFGADPADWEHATLAGNGLPTEWTLPPGRYTISLVNADGNGCNLDYLALVPVE